jgi:hypothetical protein
VGSFAHRRIPILTGGGIDFARVGRWMAQWPYLEYSIIYPFDREPDEGPSSLEVEPLLDQAALSDVPEYVEYQATWTEGSRPVTTVDLGWFV